jgi:glycerophosphoryl diester phosphodiesterase
MGLFDLGKTPGKSRMNSAHPLAAVPVAHRGLHCPAEGVWENTCPAFQRAARAGFGIELDVRLSRDGQAVVFHDDTLVRAAGRPERVDSLDAAELGRIRLFGGAATVPLLSEALKAVAGRSALYIELKNGGRHGALERAVCRELSRYSGVFAVASFNPLSIAWFAQNKPEFLRGIISCWFEEEENRSSRVFKRVVLGNLWANRLVRPDFIAYDIRRLPVRAVSGCRKNGIPVLGWTCRSADDEILARRHCDNVVFEGYMPARQPEEARRQAFSH